MARSGLLAAAPGSTGVINTAPGFRQIPPVIYNLLPADLKAVIGGPAGTVGSPVDIASDGAATVFDLSGLGQAAGETEQRFTVALDQIIPRPFCASGPRGTISRSGARWTCARWCRWTGLADCTANSRRRGGCSSHPSILRAARQPARPTTRR